MGSGKSTVVAEFQRLGVPAFVADREAARLYDDPSFISLLRQQFGDEVMDQRGAVDKRRLADIVFNDRGALSRLNAIVHPRVMDLFDRFCQAHAHVPCVVFESAILYEYGLDKAMDVVVCVYLDLDERLRRLRLRDGLDDRLLLQRIANQDPADEAFMKADYVVLNYEGNPRQRQVQYILEHVA